jgi:DNA-binding NtrC family response regulator
MPRILVVDDEVNMRRVLASILEDDGQSVSEASGLSEAKALIESGVFECVLTDQRMKDGQGMDVLEACREADPSLPVVFITAYATVELAVEAMRQGAFDFLPKPFQPEQVRAVVRRACERTALVRENELLRGQVLRMRVQDDLVGASPALERVRQTVAKVAPTSTTVLISGETGTGKELVARAIHRRSRRAAKPFLAVNCAAFAENLLDSELFGHERGAFTGADRTRQGLFEAAHEGTLFLDEAGEMALALQAKLLRVLMDGEVVRVGSTAARKVDVRILVATHRDLPRWVEKGLFRQDLYYRLAVVPLEIPPLRDRAEDIPLLVEHFLDQVARDLKVPRRRIAPAALDGLVHYAFPGNVRELRNLIERAYILSGDGDLSPAAFPSIRVSDGGQVPGETVPEGTDLRRTLESVERRLLVKALEAAGGVQAEAARRLGISRSDMAYKLKKFGLEAGRR